MSSHPIINKLYQLSEKSGEILGNIVASIINISPSLSIDSLDKLKNNNEEIIKDT